MDDLLRDFLPRFVVLSRVRLENAARAFDGGPSVDRRGYADEMHALGGEAAVLDLPRVYELAREAERVGKAWAASATPDARASCQAALERVRAAIAEVSKEAGH